MPSKTLSEETRAKNRERSRLWGEKNKDLVNERGRQWYAANKERRLEKGRQWRKANPDKAKALAEKHRETQRACAKKWREENKEKTAERVAAWAAENRPNRLATAKKYRKAKPHVGRAQCARYLARQKQAVPAWSDPAKVLAFYELAQELQKMTGQPYHVDHIIPLQGKMVCGLHCETNLQVLSAADNCSKSNKFDWGAPPVRTGMAP